MPTAATPPRPAADSALFCSNLIAWATATAAGNGAGNGGLGAVLPLFKAAEEEEEEEEEEVAPTVSREEVFPAEGFLSVSSDIMRMSGGTCPISS